MALITWNDSLSVGVRSIDKQHGVLVELLNELYDAMTKGQAMCVTGRLLERLLRYARIHFSHEESLMQAAQYPGLALHQLQHHILARQVEDYYERLERGEIAVSVHLLHFLRDWLTQHIQKDDHAFGPWLNDHGIR